MDNRVQANTFGNVEVTKIHKNTAAKVKYVENAITEHRVKRVHILNGYHIEVTFWDGIVKEFDAEKLIGLHPAFDALKNYEFFKQIYVIGNFAIGWSDEVDIGAEYLWENGTTIDNPFDSLISMKDATDLYGLNESTLRKALARGKLVEGVDAKKFGKQWVLNRYSIERVYGPR